MLKIDRDYFLEQKRLVGELEQAFLSKSGKTTTVEMVEDYANDDQFCLTSVAFVPKEIAHIIAVNIIDPLREIDPKQFYFGPDNLHLTIKNIRTINNPPLFSASDIEKVDGLFHKIIPRSPVFQFQLEDVITFPTSVSLMGYGNTNLQNLVLKLDKGLKEIGLPDDKKYLSETVYWGNITVCRFTHKPSEKFLQKVRELRLLKVGNLNVSEINLVTGNVVLDTKTRKILHKYRLLGD